MSITIGSSFHLAAAIPIDDRFVVADTTARDAIVAGVRYEGLIVYSVADATNFQLVGGVTNGDWTQLSGGGGGNFTTDLFSGDGVTVDFTLAVDPGIEDNTFVFVDGVYQQKDTYAVSTTTLTFSEAPPLGTNNVQVISGGSTNAGVLTPADGSVTEPKMANAAVSARTITDAALGSEGLINHGLSVTLAAGVVTIALKNQAGNDPSSTDPVKVAFGNATVTTGNYVVRSIIAALSTTIVSTDTGGVPDNVMGRIHIFLIDNAGTPELAWAGSNYWCEDDLVTTITGGGASTLYNTMYSTTGRTNVRFRYIGYFESTQTTSGTWAANPTKIGLYPHSPIKAWAKYQYDTNNGYGSTNTKIRKWSNVTAGGFDPSPALLTVLNDATNGMSIQANRRCRITIMFSDNMGSGYVGISKNSNQLTTNIYSITISDRMIWASTPGGDNPIPVTITDIAKPGDIYRPHGDGAAIGGSQADRAFIRILAEEL